MDTACARRGRKHSSKPTLLCCRVSVTEPPSGGRRERAGAGRVGGRPPSPLLAPPPGVLGGGSPTSLGLPAPPPRAWCFLDPEPCRAPARVPGSVLWPPGPTPHPHSRCIGVACGFLRPQGEAQGALLLPSAALQARACGGGSL